MTGDHFEPELTNDEAVRKGLIKRSNEDIGHHTNHLIILKRECVNAGHVPFHFCQTCRCFVCGETLSWWCPDSPNKQCKYPDGDEYCEICGQPDERK